VSEEGFSDEIVKTVLSFLRDRFPRSDNPTSDAASYSVRLALYAAGQFVASRYLGTVAVSLNRFGVSGQLKQKFKEKCRHSLHLGKWPLTFDENKSQRVLMRSRP
jgi:hypothetical protein